MKKIRTQDAAGHVLCHDITQIIPGVMKDARFRKGHIVTAEDIPALLSIGKEHLYIWENDDTKYHENEAAEILCGICINEHMERSEVKEGKIELRAGSDGLLKIDKERLDKINSLGEIMIASCHQNVPVKQGGKICATRIIPLIIEKEKLEEAQRVFGGKPIFTILPYKQMTVGIVTTGSEVYLGRIQDGFGPVLREKVKEYGGEILGQTITDDKLEHIEKAIRDFLNQGADMILVSGGMSVDPDDCTPLAIKNTGVQVISYGAPVLPGAMFMLGYDEKKRPVVGLPGCVMYSRRTIFDLILPRLMAGDPVTKADLDSMGCGGLCLSCETCHYPNCGFGK